MKKYVRVESLYKESQNTYDQVVKREDLIGVPLESNAAKLTITKQSDKLEDLCDRYILKDTDIIYLNKEKTKYRFEGSDEWYGVKEWFDITSTELEKGIYGAIWTDKGLIYTAKMNSNNEFELI